MARKAKGTEQSDAPLEGTALNGHTAKPAAKKAGLPRRRTASRKTSAPKTSASPRISDEAIRMRAYFIAEQRERMSLPGNADSDWLEARRQLLAELGQS